MLLDILPPTYSYLQGGLLGGMSGFNLAETKGLLSAPSRPRLPLERHLRNLAAAQAKAGSDS
jgi:hypothetical protein